MDSADDSSSVTAAVMPTMGHDILLVGPRRYSQPMAEAIMNHNTRNQQNQTDRCDDASMTLDDWAVRALEEKLSRKHALTRDQLLVHLMETLEGDDTISSPTAPIARQRRYSDMNQIVLLIPVPDNNATAASSNNNMGRYLFENVALRRELSYLDRHDIARQRVTIVAVVDSQYHHGPDDDSAPSASMHAQTGKDSIGYDEEDENTQKVSNKQFRRLLSHVPVFPWIILPLSSSPSTVTNNSHHADDFNDDKNRERGSTMVAGMIRERTRLASREDHAPLIFRTGRW